MNPATDPAWLLPDWPAPSGVGALMSTRAGGVSQSPYDSMNLGAFVGDAEEAVQANQRRLAERMGGAQPVFLRQVHGTRVLNLDELQALPQQPIEADASITTLPGHACTATVADCLPVLFAAPEARGVGAAHAGWRGLAGGVLENTVHALCDAADCEPDQLVAWLGPCIGPRQFEVGADVVRAFGSAAAQRFTPRPGLTGKWLADLPALARDRLSALGLNRISGGHWCTVEEASRFFSFRRDRVTGRMAACVWLDASPSR